jgi:ribosomal protein L34
VRRERAGVGGSVPGTSAGGRDRARSLGFRAIMFRGQGEWVRATGEGLGNIYDLPDRKQSLQGAPEGGGRDRARSLGFRAIMFRGQGEWVRATGEGLGNIDLEG